MQLTGMLMARAGSTACRTLSPKYASLAAMRKPPLHCHLQGLPQESGSNMQVIHAVVVVVAVAAIVGPCRAVRLATPAASQLPQHAGQLATRLAASLTQDLERLLLPSLQSHACWPVTHTAAPCRIAPHVRQARLDRRADLEEPSGSRGRMTRRRSSSKSSQCKAARCGQGLDFQNANTTGSCFLEAGEVCRSAAAQEATPLAYPATCAPDSKFTSPSPHCARGPAASMAGRGSVTQHLPSGTGTRAESKPYVHPAFAQCLPSGRHMITSSTSPTARLRAWTRSAPTADGAASGAPRCFTSIDTPVWFSTTYLLATVSTCLMKATRPLCAKFSLQQCGSSHLLQIS